MQSWAVRLTLVVSLSGVALELLGGTFTLVGLVLSLVAAFDLALLVAPEHLRVRWLPLSSYVYGVALLSAWCAAFYLLYPSPLADHLILLGAFMLPALYLPYFADLAVGRALLRAGGVLGVFVLLALPHAFATAAAAGPFDGFLFPLILLKTHGMTLALLAGVRAHVENLRFLAHCDALTGLANRRCTEAALELALAETRRTGRACAVLLLDVDHFKRVNDVQGHETGDLVLREVARRLARELRAEDVLGRWGGEEFLVVLVLAEPHEVGELGERLRRAVADARLLGAHRVTLSVGGTTAQAGDSCASLVARADRALYRAKQGGRNRTAMAESQPTPA